MSTQVFGVFEILILRHGQLCLHPIMYVETSEKQQGKATVILVTFVTHVTSFISATFESRS